MRDRAIAYVAALGTQQLDDELQLVHGALALQKGVAAEQLREDAAHGPHVDGGVVVLLEEDQFRGTVPTRHHVLRQLPLHGGLLPETASVLHVTLAMRGR